MSVDSIRFVVLQELRHHHVGAANAISRENLFDYVQSCFRDQIFEDDRDMREAIKQLPEILWRQGRGYFIAAKNEKLEVDKRVATLESYRDSFAVHAVETKKAYPNFYNPGEQGKLNYDPDGSEEISS